MTATTMPNRFLVTTVLAAALLFSQGGHLLVAALCPHLQTGMASCNTQPAAGSMSHEDMGHMGHMGHDGDMEMQPEPASHSNSETPSLGQPNDQCSHCAVHSRTTPNTASLRETEAPKRSVDFDIPIDMSGAAPVAVSPMAVLTSRAHGPPGSAIPRHILISSFRI